MKTFLTSIFLLFAIIAQTQTPDTAAIRKEINSLITISDSLSKASHLDEALIIMQKAHEKCLVSIGKQTLFYANVCAKLGLIYYSKKELSEAQDWAQESLSFFKNNEDQINDPTYKLCFGLLVETYFTTGQYDKAEAIQIENLKRNERIIGKNNKEYAVLAMKVGNYYFHTGSNKKAKPYFQESLAIFEKTVGKNNPDYASTLVSLGHVSTDLGDYEKAEALYLEAQNIFESNEELNEHQYFMHCLDGLGTLYYNLGQYEKVGVIDTKNLLLKEKLLGKDHPDYANSLNNLGVLYQKLEQYEKAEKFYFECKKIEEKQKGTDHPDYAGTLINLGILFKSKGENKQALTYYKEAIKTFESNEDLQEHEFYMNCLTSLGNLYTVIGEPEKAKAYYLKDVEVRKAVLGKNHYSYSTSLDNFGVLYKDLEEYNKAEPLFIEANDIRRSVLLKASKHLSEAELLNLIKLFNKNQNDMLAFAYLSEKLASHVYDNSLFYKGFLLNATLRINRLAQTDAKSLKLYQRLKECHQELSDLYTEPLASRDIPAIASLEEKANKAEKELTKSVTGIGEAKKQVYWQDVQAVLGPNEIAVEFEYFSIFNKNGTDTIMYAALLLMSEGKPKLIPLFNQEDINHLLSSNQERRSDYVNDLYTIDSRGATVLGKSKKTLFELIWLPLKPHIKDKTTIYFSPSGLLHRINIPAIPLDDELSLCDQYTFVQVNSTRQIINKNQNNTLSNSALLMGGIEYDIESTPDIDELIDLVASRAESNINSPNNGLRGDSWNYLKYTEKEVNNINELLLGNGYYTDVETNTSASEEKFCQNTQGETSPRILHLATHGYFFPDPNNSGFATGNSEPAFKTSDHPMIRSGLILAGGNHVWQGNPAIQGKEDGILTAYEISQLDLSNTELVVLSACETGLGDIEGNEGVYGLQRAFKIAGAKYLIMSLWQIPDRETKDFMVRFYEHFLEDKMTIPDAFRLTQKEMKERFYNPHQWAGFVLVE